MPTGAKAKNEKPVPLAASCAPLTTRFAGVPISEQRPPSSVAKEIGISTARSGMPRAAQTE